MKGILQVAAIITLTVAAFFPGGVSAQWSQTNGPDGGSITSISVHDQNILATAQSGVFLSTNAGATWKPYDEGFTNRAHNFNASYVNGTEMLLGTTQGGIYHRAPGDPDWQPLGLAGYYIFSLGGHNGKLFAGGVGITFRSTDNGSTWLQSDSGMASYTTTNSFLSDGAILWAMTSNGVYLSEDDGRSWTAKSTGLGCANARAMVRVNSTLVSIACSHVYISTDAGESWESKASANSYYYDIAYVSGTVFASAYGMISVSTDQGQTWTAQTDDLPSDYLFSLKALGTKVVLATSYSGILVSNDLGAHWSASSSGMNAAQTLQILSVGDTLIVGATNGLFRSTDDGNTWSSILPRTIPSSVAGIAHDGQYLWTAYYKSFASVVMYRSTDRGTSWDSVGTGIPSYAFVTNLDTVGGVLCLPTISGLLISVDAGINWNTVSGIPGSSSVQGVTGANGIFFTTGPRGVFFSSDTGASWEQRNNGLADDTSGYRIRFIDGKLYLGTSMGSIYTSSDSGMTWVFAFYASNPTSFSKIGGTIFLTTLYGLQRSTNGGTTWLPASEGLADSACSAIVKHNGSLFLATTWNGVWKRPASELVTGVAGGTGKSLPVRVELLQSYPNPFNPSATFAFRVNEPGIVSLAVFDLLGREVASIVNESLPPGSYSRTWDATGFPSGTYFYRLSLQPREGSGESLITAVRKMMLLK